MHQRIKAKTFGELKSVSIIWISRSYRNRRNHFRCLYWFSCLIIFKQTIIRTRITCKKIPCYMYRWCIVEYAKIFWSYVNYFLIFLRLRVRLHVTETNFHPGMKKFLFTSEFHLGMKRVECHPGMKFNLKGNLPLSMKTYKNFSF